MGRQFSWIFLGVSAAFFLFITGLTGYRVDAVRRANAESAGVRAVTMAARARQLAAGPGGFAGPTFKDGMPWYLPCRGPGSRARHGARLQFA